MIPAFVLRNIAAVVIDDPMTSLDEHRSLPTMQEIRRLTQRVSQVVVLSHAKPFLCAVWDGADRAARTAIKIARDGEGSDLQNWDVRLDTITEHDKRHEKVAAYLLAADAAEERNVAAALRPILEASVRVAYSADFLPGSLLGPFLGIYTARWISHRNSEPARYHGAARPAGLRKPFSPRYKCCVGNGDHQRLTACAICPTNDGFHAQKLTSWSGAGGERNPNPARWVSGAWKLP